MDRGVGVQVDLLVLDRLPDALDEDGEVVDRGRGPVGGAIPGSGSGRGGAVPPNRPSRTSSCRPRKGKHPHASHDPQRVGCKPDRSPGEVSLELSRLEVVRHGHSYCLSSW